jgi:peptidoglycan/LPS O-acetylase OafA/YrhL
MYFITGFGHQAVMVFFVLSGFLISSTVLKSHLSGSWSWGDYAINRSTRLYVVLIPGLLFGLLWDHAGSSRFASTGIYTHAISNLGAAIPADNLTAGNFFGNLSFLQTILCPTFGSNGPLWSLANEFWYYVLFPVVLSAGLAWRRKFTTAAIPLTALALCLAFFLGLDKFIGFLVWMSGCVLVFAYSRLRLRTNFRLFLYLMASFFVFWGTLFEARTSTSTVLGSDLGVGIAFALLLFGILQLEIRANSPRYMGISRQLAGFSYSLYVLHFPMLLFLRSWIVPQERWQPDARNFFYAVFVGSGVLLFAWLISLFTEKKTHDARDLVRRVAGRWITRSQNPDCRRRVHR